jgi:hypothetical protein
MQQYESVHKNVGMTPRTIDEAFKTADYATPIWRCESDTEKGIKFFIDMLIGMLLVGLPMVALYGFISWLDTVK